MKKLISTLIFFVLIVAGYGQTRNVLVGTNNSVVSPTNFWSVDASNARTGLGLGTAATNTASAFQPASSALTNLSTNNGGSLTNLTASSVVGTVGLASNVTGTVAITNGGSGATTADGARTNLGLGLAALTNTSNTDFLAAFFGANTNPVLVDTNGSVVSPTNFWQTAPISTLVQLVRPDGGLASVTNNATNARNLYLYSLTPAVGGVTNTIQLPTNGGTFLGDVATVIHEGPTNSITAIRQIGAATNIITMNQFQEAVKFIYETDGWRLADNLSQIEPIYFSGTNAADNAAASRTNLGLGTTNNVTFNNITASGVLTSTGNLVAISNASVGGTLTSTGVVTMITNLNVGGAINVTNKAETRTNLGIPLSALTNTSNSTFQASIFSTNTTPTNSANVNGVGFNTAIAWMEVSVITNGATNSYRIPLFR